MSKSAELRALVDDFGEIIYANQTAQDCGFTFIRHPWGTEEGPFIKSGLTRALVDDFGEIIYASQTAQDCRFTFIRHPWGTEEGPFIKSGLTRALVDDFGEIIYVDHLSHGLESHATILELQVVHEQLNPRLRIEPHGKRPLESCYHRPYR